MTVGDWAALKLNIERPESYTVSLYFSILCPEYLTEKNNFIYKQNICGCFM